MGEPTFQWFGSGPQQALSDSMKRVRKIKICNKEKIKENYKWIYASIPYKRDAMCRALGGGRCGAGRHARGRRAQRPGGMCECGPVDVEGYSSRPLGDGAPRLRRGYPGGAVRVCGPVVGAQRCAGMAT